MTGWTSGPTTGAELEKALAAAEALNAQVERDRRRTGRVVGLVAVAMAACLLGCVAIITWATSTVEVAAIGSTVAGLVASALTLGGGAAGYLRTRRQAALAEQSMIEIVTPVREAFPLIAAREGWSDARRQALLSRLRRFPIVARGR